MALILIAEDEKGMQDILTDYMRHGGHTCITADDGIDAVTILKNNPVDLAVLDIMMPHLDGFSVCRIAREMYTVLTTISQNRSVPKYFLPRSMRFCAVPHPQTLRI